MENNCEAKAKPRPKNVKEFFTSRYFWKPFSGVAIGGIAGFLYYYFVGCTSGHCPITSNPYVSILWGGALGWFVVSSPCSRGKC
jgi:hypothetical protein